MPRDARIKQQQLRARIAAGAARIMAEDGVDDFALAKRKAARQLGAEDGRALPNNEEVETELRAYQALFQGEEQRSRIRFLRRRALEAMHALAGFKPYLVGPVLKGTAGRYSDVDLQLFTDDSKAVELFLLDRGIGYEVSEQRHFNGDRERAVSILRLEWTGVAFNLAVYADNDERGVLKTSPCGRPIERANSEAVGHLVAADE